MRPSLLLACASALVGRLGTRAAPLDGAVGPSGAPAPSPVNAVPSRRLEEPLPMPGTAPSTLPMEAPTRSPTPKTAVSGRSMISGACPDGQMEILVSVRTDRYPIDTRYTLTNDCPEEIFAPIEYDPNDKETLYEDSYCVPIGQYTFVFFDDYGDGLCCAYGEGYYNVTSDGVVVASGDVFTNKTISTTFGTTCPPTPATTTAPSQQPTTPSPTKAPVSSAPTHGPSASPTSMPSKSPTSGPASAACPGEMEIIINVKTDNYPIDTRYTLTNDCPEANFAPIEYDPTGKNTLYEDTRCVPTGQYTFVFNDDYGDGLCCAYGDGYYNVTSDGVVVASGDVFTNKVISTTFGSCPPTPAPTTQPPTGEPTGKPTIQKPLPSPAPSQQPTTPPPTKAPISSAPTQGPSPSPTSKPSKSPTSSPAFAACPGAMEVVVNVKTDDYPQDTSWTLTSDCDSSMTPIVGNPSAQNTLYEVMECVPTGQYTFVFNDDYGDGLCCAYGDGYYNVASDGVVVVSGDVFTDKTISTTFGTTCPPTPPPTMGPTPPPTPCPSAAMKIDINLRTDNNAAETSWALENLCDGTERRSPPYTEDNTLYSESYCVNNSRYRFVIRDSSGDGLSDGNGSYEVYLNDNLLKSSGGNFGSSESVTFGSCGSYQYTTGSPKCGLTGADNLQGPALLSGKENVALQFFAIADTPYDKGCNACNTCWEDGKEVDNCNDYDCTDLGNLVGVNTCTYKGPEYKCLENSIIPYMNADSEAAFVVHAGDILGGNPSGENKRCTEYSFRSRRDLFEQIANFLLVAGDNDWNECQGYDLSRNDGDLRDTWRQYFAANSFDQFQRDFPPTAGFLGGSRPTIDRSIGSNPELFYFVHNHVAVFGLNRVAGANYINDEAPTNVNAVFVEDRLGSDANCEIRSIVIVSHVNPKSVVYTKLNEYFDRCRRTLPILTITGNTHPKTYCMSRSGNRIDMTIEAFRSGPLKISVVRDPSGDGGDFFRADDSDLTNSNSQCPNFAR